MKKKVSEQASADFKNNPFKSLKSFTPKPAQTPKKTVPAREQKENTHEDDTTLFLRAVEGARKREGAPGPAAGPAKPKAVEKTGLSVQEDQELFFQAMQKIGTTFREDSSEPEDEDSSRRSSTSRMRQLKRGTIRISRELDLHGFLKDEALKRLERFIIDAFDLGQKAVLVITGKGANSPEGPVLQGAVDAWLRGKGKGKVAEFSSAPRDKGGSGAFVVFLKKK
jgi:DNA-nicking Smr family endonuclease